MKITIDADIDSTPEKQTIVLSDDGFNVPGFLDIYVGNVAYQVHISDLRPAVEALYIKYMEGLKREKLLE
jgi:hypothetical protein